ncbi:FRG domain-containing protein [Leptospira noguchii]|uniref:FRG domain protein n=1 Tax=Leptospira noguchii serovar Panama str. CZ214 TaxID=1001595 RepID=T0FIM2_9LEPT|nr:FRG domain-containing protein [Leptospira noguchii]EQA69505.1 FRG domain protein [Leptospira noguchii serovar Panama str. CZ214]
MENIELTTIEEILFELSPSNKRWEEPIFSKYAFRGQANKIWQLIPKVIRKGTKFYTDDRIKKGRTLNQRTIREQIELEFNLIYQFVEHSNQSGLYTPNDHEIFKEFEFLNFIDYLNQIGRGTIAWPTKKYYPIISMAQHYNLPTCFLDFTLNPYIALYFAAKGALQVRNNDVKFSVYAINVNVSAFRIGDYDKYFPEEKEAFASRLKSRTRYQFIQSTSFSNHNQIAQKGVFLGLVRENRNPNAQVELLSVEDYIKNQIEESENFIKITILKKFAPEILRLLSKHSVDALHLFPGHTQFIKEKELWF